MNKKSLFILIPIFILSGIAIAYFIYKNKKVYSPEDLIQIGHDFLDEKDYFKAFNYYYSAILKGEVDAEIYWLSSRLAVKLKRYGDAQKYGEKAWKKGIKNKELLTLLIVMDPQSKEKKYLRAKKMLSELPGRGDSFEFFKGNLFYYFNDSKNSLKHWLPLFKKSPSPILGSAILRTLIDQNSIEQAIDSGVRFSQKGNLDEQGYLALADLHAINGELVEQIQMYEQSIQRGFYGGMGLSFRSGKAAFVQGHWEAAKSHFEMVYKEPFFIQEDLISIPEFLEELSERKRPIDKLIFNKLSKDSQVFVETTHDFPLPDIWGLRHLILDLNVLLKNETFGDGKIDESLSIVSHNRNFLTTHYPNVFQSVHKNPIWREMRLYFSYLNYLNDETNEEIITSSEEIESSSFEEGVSAWKASLAYEKSHEYELSQQELEKAMALIPKHPLLRLQQAFLFLKKEEFKQSADLYQSIALNDILFSLSPILNVNWAKSQVYLGEDKLALRTLSRLHEKGIYSEASMKLFRNLMAKQKQFENSESSQRFITEHLNNSNDTWGKGLLLYSKGKYSEAEQVFTDLKKQNPKNDQYKLAELATLLSQKKYKEVIIGAESSKLNNPFVLVLKAMAYVELGQKDKAILTYDVFLEGKFDREIHKNYVDYLISQNEIDKAEKVILKDPLWDQSDELMTQMADIHLKTRRVSSAHDLLKKTMGMDTRFSKAYVLLAQLHLNRGEAKVVSGICEKAISLFSEDKQIRFIYGLSEFHLQRWKNAEKNLIWCHDEYSEDPDWLWAYYHCLIALEKYEEALKAYKKMQDILPKGDYLVREKILLEALMGNLEDSLGLFEMLEKESVENAILKSKVLKMAKQYSSAIGQLENYKSNDNAYFYWLCLELEYGKKDVIFKELQKKSFSKPAWLTLGSLAEKSKRFEDAAQIYEIALKKFQDDAMLWNNYAWNAHQNKNLRAEALKAIETAYTLNENDSDIIDSFAYILLDHENFEKCQDLLENKPDFTIASPRLLYALGRCYEENILNKMAKEKYLESIKFSKNKTWDLPISENQLLEKVKNL